LDRPVARDEELLLRVEGNAHAVLARRLQLNQLTHVLARVAAINGKRS
jgi:hypothetical protein